MSGERKDVLFSSLALLLVTKYRRYLIHRRCSYNLIRTAKCYA